MSLKNHPGRATFVSLATGERSSRDVRFPRWACVQRALVEE